MIKYTETSGDSSITVECETMGELIQYLKADKREERGEVNLDGVTANENVDKVTENIRKFNKEWRESLYELDIAPE